MDIDVGSWRDRGYVVARGVLPPEVVGRLLPIAERVLAQARIADATRPQRGGDELRNLFHPNHPDYHRGRPEDATALLDAGSQASVLAVPRAIYGEEPLFRCLSLWCNPLAGRQDGHWHRDTQFLHPDLDEERRVFDARAGHVVGGQFQIALVANDDLEVVPGSHCRWDTPEEFAIRRAGEPTWRRNDMPGAERIALEPGDGVIFDAAMLHRGRYHADRPRRTFMVTTSTLGGARDDYFTQQPWFLERGYLDGLDAGAQAFYRRFLDTFASRWQPVGAGAG